MLAFLINHTFVNFHTYLKKRSQNLILISLDLHFRHLRFLSQTDFYFYAFSILNCNTLLKQNLHSVFLLKFHFHDKHFKKKKKKPWSNYSFPRMIPGFSGKLLFKERRQDFKTCFICKHL